MAEGVERRRALDRGLRAGPPYCSCGASLFPIFDFGGQRDVVEADERFMRDVRERGVEASSAPVGAGGGAVREESGGPGLTAIEFDLDRYLRASKKLDLSHLDWDEIPNHPLTDGDVMCLHYMMDIETHTVIYLRDLGDRAANDPQVTAFLSCWVYEELWHGGVLGLPARVWDRGAAGARVADGSTPLPTRRRRTQALREELGVGAAAPSLLPMMLGSMLFRDFVALHMTWGALNELTAHRLRADPPLRPSRPAPDAAAGDPGRAPPLRLLPRAVQGAAGARRAAPAGSSAGSSTASGRRWVPAVKSQEEVDALTLYLFGYDDEGREMFREIDRTISDIPGLEGPHRCSRTTSTARSSAPGATPAGLDVGLPPAGSRSSGGSQRPDRSTASATRSSAGRMSAIRAGVETERRVRALGP